MLNWVFAALVFIGGTVALGICVVFASVGLGILRRGRAAADEAYQRGDSLKAWFDPAQTTPIEGPSHDVRAALAGRKSKAYGVVAVSEHASDHVYSS
jgi:hypothetical protein